MPIYEYQCQSCGHQLEKLQRISDEHLRDCPDCGEAELSRLVSAAAFRLKGAGWYETDFKKGDKKNLHDSNASAAKPATNGSGASPDSAKTGNTKAESKPKAAKADSA